ncbi:kynureninase [Bacillus sp. 2205SS5-2]|uniref:kynureninase n=1 Tax=Bacillus sp. 2205SS5-2 TaxID=3109031 RepID=UPI003007A10B
MENALSFAKEFDQRDILSPFRSEFYLQPETIYLDGNSLGLLSRRAERAVYSMMEAWKSLGIDGWTEGEHPWFYLSETLGEKLAPLVGANKEEIIVTASTTVNLHQLLATFYQPSGKRTKILCDELNFPSDIYAIKSQLKLKGYSPEDHLVQVKSEDGRFLKETDIVEAMTEDIALIVLPTVLYRSGQLLDLKYLTTEAHKRGILIGFDGCHSVGAIPHYFSEWGVDFAYWCTYKYLNSGPGGVGALYVNEHHHGVEPGLAGWFGSDKSVQFDMSHEFTPAQSASAFQIATPHILSSAPLIGSLEMMNEANIINLREKSLSLTSYLMKLIGDELDEFDFTIGNPIDDATRGGHVSLEHNEAARICKALKAEGVIPDFRSPNVIRLAPVPLYCSFEDVYKCVEVLKNIMVEKKYERFENKRNIIA